VRFDDDLLIKLRLRWQDTNDETRVDESSLETTLGQESLNGRRRPNKSGQESLMVVEDQSREDKSR